MTGSPTGRLWDGSALFRKVDTALLKLIERGYDSFHRAAVLLQPLLLLAIRAYWGWQFWQTGWGKLTDISKPIDYFTSLGIPFPVFNAYFIGLLETVGGILLILGLGSRLIALLLTVDMLVAYIVADREALGSIISEPEKFYNAAPFTFLLASLIILAFGPGWLSLDTLIKWRRSKKQPLAVTDAAAS
jgi:putative oxidoreductase